jgi:hypothetical protein
MARADPPGRRDPPQPLPTRQEELENPPPPSRSLERLAGSLTLLVGVTGFAGAALSDELLAFLLTFAIVALGVIGLLVLWHWLNRPSVYKQRS